MLSSMFGKMNGLKILLFYSPVNNNFQFEMFDAPAKIISFHIYS